MDPSPSPSSPPADSPLRHRRVVKNLAPSSTSAAGTQAQTGLQVHLPSPTSSRSSSVCRLSEVQVSATSPLPSSPPSTSSDDGSEGDEVVPLHRPYYCFCDKCIPETPGVESAQPNWIPTAPASILSVPAPSLNSRIQAVIRESVMLWGLIYLLAFVLRWSTLIATIHLPILTYMCYSWWDPSFLLGGLPTLLLVATTTCILELAFALVLVMPHLARLNTFYDQPTRFPTSRFDRQARWYSLRQLVSAAHPETALPTHPATSAGRALLRASRPRASPAGQPYSTMPHIGHFWQGWFKGAAPCDIKRDNVKEWLAWAFFNMRLDEVERRDEVKTELEEMVKYIEAETGAEVPPGFNEAVECMRIGLDEKRVAWRGGIYYALMTTVNLSIILLFRLIGYTNIHSSSGDLLLHIPARYTRPASTLTRPIKKPILLLHGLAVGMTPYLPWCLYTYLTTGRPIIFLHMPSVSIRLFAPQPPTPASFNSFLQSTWAQFPHLPRATLIGSSLGTAVASWAIKDPVTMRDVIDSAVLTDPISFGLCFVDVAQNFLYKSPTNWVELAIRVLGAREPNVANYLYRHFWWFENVIWKSEWKASLESSAARQVERDDKDEPASASNPTGRLAIFLAEFDTIVNAEAVKRYLDQEGELSVTVIPDIGHGAFVFTPTLWADVKRAVQETARNAGAKEEEIERTGSGWW